MGNSARNDAISRNEATGRDKNDGTRRSSGFGKRAKIVARPPPRPRNFPACQLVLAGATKKMEALGNRADRHRRSVSLSPPAVGERPAAKRYTFMAARDYVSTGQIYTLCMARYRFRATTCPGMQRVR